MSLIELLIYVVVLGLVLHLINNVMPGPAWLKTVVNVVACLVRGGVAARSAWLSFWLSLSTQMNEGEK